MGCRLVKLVNRLKALKSRFVNAVIAAELLKLAVGGTNAGKTLLIVCRKNKLQGGSSCFLNFLGVCKHLHTLTYGVYAGGNNPEASALVSLDNADTAGADLVLFLHKAECGNFNSR